MKPHSSSEAKPPEREHFFPKRYSEEEPRAFRISLATSDPSPLFRALEKMEAEATDARFDIRAVLRGKS